MTTCTCPPGETPERTSHQDACPIFEQEVQEAQLLAGRAAMLLCEARNPRIAATALHLLMTKLAQAMQTTPQTLAETMLKVARDLGGPVS